MEQSVSDFLNGPVAGPCPKAEIAKHGEKRQMTRREAQALAEKLRDLVITESAECFDGRYEAFVTAGRMFFGVQFDAC
jgi:hypothetical protein